MKNFARLLGAAAILAAGSAFAQTAICYNCPPEWADWGTQLKMIKEKTGITVPQDNKNSGQSLAQLGAIVLHWSMQPLSRIRLRRIQLFTVPSGAFSRPATSSKVRP